MLTKGLWLSFGHSTEVWVLSLSNLHHLIDVWMLTQGCYPLGTQLRFWPFCCCLVLPPFQDTYACKLFQQVLSSSLQISSPLFQGALPLPALSVSWGCYKSFLPVAVLNYSICIICSFDILQELSKPWNDKKVFKYFKFQKKESLSNKKYFSAVVWNYDCSRGMFAINVTYQGC